MSDLNNFDDDFFGDIAPKEDDVLSMGKPTVTKQPIKAWKIIVICIIGLAICGLIYLLVGGLYTRYIRFPDQEFVEPTSTGAYAIGQYESLVHNQESLTDEDYLVKEITYANSNSEKLKFINKVVNTVHYSFDIVNAKNVYGNDMIDRATGTIVTIPSPVVEGEEVNLAYINYDSIEFESEESLEALDKLILRYGLTLDDVSYSNTLVDMFCTLISEMEVIPIKTDRHIPALTNLGESYAMLADEDVYLDRLLFSSESFRNCQMRFAEAVGKRLKGTDLTPSDEWVEWSELAPVKQETTNEPLKYGKQSILRNWCGAYYILNEYYVFTENGEKVQGNYEPMLGDGTFDNPASKNTPVITYIIDEAMNKYPIRVEMTEFGVSEDALVWFQSKDPQNRGYTLNSEVQYCYGVFKVTNLSSIPLEVYNNASLCDKNVNLSPRTGNIYGITESLVLAPDETGYIEFWSRSTELHKKYLIWGADFARRCDPVWFRVLMGDLEDTSEYKGVHVITPGSTTSVSTSNTDSSATD